MRRILMAAVIALIPLATAAQDSESERNEKRMIDAARKLEWTLPDNRAQLLVKKGTIDAPVAVIFGYVDNSEACEQIVDALHDSRVSSFVCNPIY